MTQMERLEECYTAAFNADDINLCLEIADRIKMLATPSSGVIISDDVKKFTEMLDTAIHCHENNSAVVEHHFDYGGHKFEVKLIDGE